MKAQAASTPFTPVYASMISVINTKFPLIGELLLMRLLSQFRRAYKRSDKAVCLSSSKFLAHLVNQKIVNEIVALQILTLLLERPTDDSVEVAVGFMREAGAFLMEESSKASNAVFERFRAILHEGKIDKRTQYMVEVLFQVRKEKFKEHPAIPDDLDIVEEDDQISHVIGLADELATHDILNVYQHDEKFLENEQKYMEMKREILGDDSGDESGEEEDDEQEAEEELALEQQRQIRIIDKTDTDLVNLRRGIYLTIMSSLNFEECAHKLMKLDIKPGQETELCSMVIECCSQERTYVNFYGLLGERFCRINENWARGFASSFEETFKTIHRFETGRLRNIAKFFSHLLATDALTWEVFALIRLTEEDTTSSSRIFCKIMFTELVESMGLAKLNTRLNDTTMIVSVETAGGMVNRGVFDGLFPKDNPKNTRFAINYFTSIGLGGLTEELREYLKNAPKPVEESGNESDSSSNSSSSSSSGTSSDDSDSDSDRSRSVSPGAGPGRAIGRNPSPTRPAMHSEPSARHQERSPPRRADSPKRDSRGYRASPPRRVRDSPSRDDRDRRESSYRRNRSRSRSRDVYARRSARDGGKRLSPKSKETENAAPAAPAASFVHPDRIKQVDASPRRRYSRSRSPDDRKRRR